MRGGGGIEYDREPPHAHDRAHGRGAADRGVLAHDGDYLVNRLGRGWRADWANAAR